MSNYDVDIVVIGAGAVGLAISEALSALGREVIVLEAENNYGQITSSRNSGVIHAGIYYKKNSLKSKFCVEGNQLIYQYCKKNNVPYENTKKILVASSEDQIKVINDIKQKAKENGVKNIQKLSQYQINKIEPDIYCKEALFVPSSGIIDVVAYMRSLVGKIEDTGGMIAYNSKLVECEIENKNFVLSVLGKEKTIIRCKQLINCAGLYASEVAKKIKGLKNNLIPNTFYAKGNYFSVNKDLGIKHLIYPIPEGFGLGIHLTLELDHTVKFGPDVEWVDNPFDYKVNQNRKSIFVKEIKKYLPKFDEDLLKPSYAGIRPILDNKNKKMRDFVIQSSVDHSIPNLINLYGIESPGLTSSLAIAKYVTKLVE
tara:strand:+ start:1322 stop:2431 length:1110 start_codon:yes stop_codon:yes gene_type:complete